MTKTNKENQDQHADFLSLDKKADILQASFEHYYKMAMDHHTKAGTTSNLLLIIVGALVAVVGHDGQLDTMVDFIGGIGISIVGLFGAVWVLKQHERYYFWQLIAKEYHKNLAAVVPDFITGEKYDDDYARKESKCAFGWIAEKYWDRRLWIIFHCMVTFLGIFIAIYTWNKL